jgi:spermidine/putrescine transport system permease protein
MRSCSSPRRLLAIFVFSFWTQDFLTIDRTPTLNNYRQWLTDPLYAQLMTRSVIISLSVTAATVILAFPIAYFVSFHVDPSKKSLWIFLITIPFWTSYLIRVFLWKVILGSTGC